MSDDEFRPAQMISERLAERIRTEGSLSVAAFMAEALFHPMAGFYATKDPLGAANDFITAPEISQMFGELRACGRRNAGCRWARPRALN